jgi:outer membrane autotransporter protein
LTPEQVKDPKEQAKVVDALTKTNPTITTTEAKLVLVESSGGQFLPAVQAVGKAVSDGKYDAASKTTLDNLLNGKGTAEQVVAGLNVANGVSALAGVDAASGVASAIGGSGGVVATRQDTVMAQRRDMADQFGSSAGLASVAMNADLANRIWASPFYTWQRGDKNAQNEGYDFKAGGVSLGYDRAFGAITVGGAFTYSHGDFDSQAAVDDNTIDSYGFSLYGQYYNVDNGFFATVSGGYTYGDNDWNRLVETAAGKNWQRGDNHTDSYWFGGNVGKDFTFDTGSPTRFILTPTVGLFWSQSTGSEYRAGGAISQVIGEMKSKSLLLPIDLTARIVHQIDDCSSITFKVAGGYAYNFQNDGSEGTVRYDYVGANSFIVQGADTERHNWNIGAGVKYQYRSLDFGVDYRYDGRKHFNAHRVSATVGLSF